MTSIAQAKQAILSRLETNWAGATPLVFENEGYAPVRGTSYVRATPRLATSAQESLGGVGNRKFLRRGIVLFQVFTPSGVGTAQSDTLAMSLISIFEGTKFGGVWVTNVTAPREVGDDGEFYQANADAEFFFEEVK